jgi:hypothetical protein
MRNIESDFWTMTPSVSMRMPAGTFSIPAPAGTINRTIRTEKGSVYLIFLFSNCDQLPFLVARPVPNQQGARIC